MSHREKYGPVKFIMVANKFQEVARGEARATGLSADGVSVEDAATVLCAQESLAGMA